MHWLLGDLQGCVSALEKFVRLTNFDPTRDKLWCVGDLINRGPQSLETLQLWRDLGGHAVLGNHEVYALAYRAGRWPRKPDSLERIFSSSAGDELLETLMHCPILQAIDVPDHSRIWAVHAGIHPCWIDLQAIATSINTAPFTIDRLLRPEVAFATRVRCCTPAGEMSKFPGMPQDCPPPHVAWDTLYCGQDRIVHGHWAWRGHYIGPRSIGLDSGYVYGGSVWAYCIEEDRCIQISNDSGSRVVSDMPTNRS